MAKGLKTNFVKETDPITGKVTVVKVLSPKQ